MPQKLRPQAESLYGFPQPTQSNLLAPIISRRAPAASDTGYSLGQEWIDKVAGNAYQLVQVAAGSATWAVLGGVTSALNTINSLSPTAGNINIVGTANQISVANASSTVTLSLPSAITTPGSLTTTTTLAAGTSFSAATTITAGTGITSTTGNIVASAGNISATLGSLTAGTTVTAGTGITATTGNVTSSAGDLVASTAAKGVVLGGGAKVVCGTGDPNGSVTAPQGSLYLNLTGNSTSTRAFINSDSGTTWVAVTTAS